MSIAGTAARGVAWNMVFGSGARALQLIGTLVLTHFIAPDAYGAVLAASITVLMVGTLTTLSFGQYLIAQRAPPQEAFQASVVHVAIGVVAMLLVFSSRDVLASWLESPQMVPYVAGFAIAHIIDRVSYVPERMLLRALRFRIAATVHGSGELLYTVVALSLAPAYGPLSLVAAALVRSVLKCGLFLRYTPRGEWLEPHRVEASTVRKLVAYGVPITAAAVADRLATRWDNLIISSLLGPAVMGRYNLAYSLAEVPINHVAEYIGEVLMPAFSKMGDAERKRAVVRAAALMSLLVSPLGVGLAAVAPTLVNAFFDPLWSEMGSMLAILSVMTVMKPMTWSSIAYLQATARTQLIMALAIGRAVVVLSSLTVLALMGGPLWACVGVTIGMTAHAVVTIVATGRVTGIDARACLVGVARPLLASAPIFAAVIACRDLYAGFHLPPVLGLVLEVIAGAAAFGVGVLIVARPTALELIRLARGTLQRRPVSPSAG
jgi:PST family polysaccharide transporter